ncbi:MAG: hypothetical protein K5886_04100 [Lachnospiraceae bacterium]|nr:hypothetical protein [Lachnospiraceae bacterium]
MSLISIPFIVFCIILLITYYRIDGKHQWKVLLAFSLLFYLWAGPFRIIFILISIVSTWYLMKDPKRSHFIAVILINLGILIVFRYSFLAGIHDLFIPLGISFYTFMTIGYAHDCYDKKTKPCDDLFHYALFITYFPQITQGPIGTYEKMHDQLLSVHKYDIANIKEGGYRIIKGLCKKLVIAGRLSYYVDTVFSSPRLYGGLTLIIAVFFYAMELYADFSGYMDIACGISKMLGIELTENFKRPYFSENIQEFWRRWHISLNEWFKYHLMMPAVTSKWNKKISKVMYRIFPKAKKGTIRTVFPLILVWIVTGIWHGAEVVYIGWGVYFAVIMLLSVCTASYVKKFKTTLHWNDENTFIKIFNVLRTFIIVCLGEVMFRAETMRDALDIYKIIFTETGINKASITASLIPFGNGNQAAASAIIVFLMLSGLFTVELLQEKNAAILKKHRYVYGGILLVITALFGVLGQSSFMYQAF